MVDINLKKVNSILIFATVIIAAFYLADSFFKPFTFAIFLATLTRPMSAKIESKGAGRMLSSGLTTIMVFMVITGLIMLLLYQIKFFLDDMPQIEKEVRGFIKKLQEPVASVLGMSPEQLNEYFQRQLKSVGENIEGYIGNIMENMLVVLFHFLLVHIYLFLFLLYRKKFLNFLLMYLPERRQDQGKETIKRTAMVAFHYLWGRIKVMTVLAIMYIIAFLIFDVKYAVLFTVFGVLITIIPYIGPFISGLLPFLFYIISQDELWMVLLFFFVVIVIQLVESYVLEPVIIGSEVNLSPLMIIVAIILGGLVWGMTGMILFVPLFAILKIVFDQITSLQPVGYLIGK